MRRAPLLDEVGVGSADGSFVLAEWTDPGGGHDPPQLIAPLHLHRSDDEAWYVLDGRLAFRVGDEELEAGPGAAVYVSRGTAHAYWNPSPEPARYLILMPPRIARLVHDVHLPENRGRFREVFERYDSELLA
jgi:mannose-6-phosphate isomerase-like protein (cupin superfamily)